MVPRSNMPKYAFLLRPLDSGLTEKKMKALKFSYTAADIDALKGKTEMDAMVAYLQKLGNDIPWRRAAQAAVTGELKNPFQDATTVLPEGKEIYDRNCAQCHGADLKGGVGPSLADIGKPDVELFKAVYSGVSAGGMPAFGDTMGRERVWKVVTFLKFRQRR